MMMRDRFHLSAYWSARQEPPGKCAERATLFLDELRKINGLFATWYLKTSSRKNATAQPLVPDLDRLTQLFTAGINRRDIDKLPIAELGFNLGAWAGNADGVSASLRVTCGSYSKHVDNVCLLNVTEGHAVSADAVPLIVDAAIRAWDPDGVEVNSKRVYSRSG